MASRHRRRGFTLMEVIVTSAVMVSVVLGMGAAVTVASRATPELDDARFQAVTNVSAISEFSSELSTAVYLPQFATQSMTFVVPDRTGDGYPDRISYAWSGTPGDPLTRRFNGGSAVAVVDDVRHLLFTYALSWETETFVGPKPAPVEQLLHSYTTTSGANSVTLGTLTDASQYIQPTLPAGALSWSVRRVRYYGSRGLLGSGTTKLQVRAANVNTTPGAVLEEVSTSASSIPGSWGWIEHPIASVGGIVPGGGLFFYMQNSSLIGTALACQRNISSQHPNQFASGSTSDCATPGKYRSDDAMLLQVYGVVDQARLSATQSIQRTYYPRIELEIRTGSETQSQKVMTVMLNSPEASPVRYLTYFDEDPTVLDFNGDGLGDFRVQDNSTLTMTNLSNGRFRPSQPLVLRSTSHNFTRPTTFTVRMRDSTSGGGGASMWFEADRSGSTYAAFEARISAASDGSQTATVSMKDTSGTMVTLATSAVRAGAFADFRCLVDSPKDTIAIWIDGVHRETYKYVLATDTNRRGVELSRVSGDAGAEFDSVHIRQIP